MSTDTGFRTGPHDDQEAFDLGQNDFSSPPGSQWRAHALHMANWGGFEGITRIDLSAQTTLITGASGAGKSSLLDAYTALMMDYGVRFNGASNDAGQGRARGEDQRNLVSYLRGMTDTATVASTGERVPQVLRGKGCATWGAVGMTFRNDVGELFTALRVYYLRAGQTRDTEAVRRIATYHGPLQDFSVLEGPGREEFNSKLLREALPGIAIHPSYKAFAATLSTTLGIGASGDAENALHLLARVQAGHNFSTVDGLYKDLVIAEPTTFAAADAAIAHFNDLESSYQAMVDDLAKVTLLDPTVATHDRFQQLRARLAELESLGSDAAPDSPLSEWRLRTEESILETLEDQNREDQKKVSDTLGEAQAAHGQVKAELDAAVRDHQAAGGSELEALAAQIESLRTQLAGTERRRAAFDGGIAVLEAPLATRDDFAALTARATAGAAAKDETRAAFDSRREAIQEESHKPSAERSDLTREIESLQGRRSAIPARLDDLRRQVAAASGIPVAEMPFVAELIDVRAGEERWRDAVEVTLGGLATRMLVPEERLEHFSASIDQLKLRGRLRFDGVEPETHRERAGRPRHISSKLDFADSPYSWWVHERVTAPSQDAECVERPEDLRGGTFRVTPSGQERRGRGGAHGQNDRPRIIGFSNEHTLHQLRTRLADLNLVLTEIKDRLQALQAEQDQETSLQEAYTRVLATAWDDIDVDGITTTIGDLDARRQRILASDQKLKDLEAEVNRLRGAEQAASRLVWGFETQLEALRKDEATLVARKDTVTGQVISIERRDVSRLTPAATELIETKIAAFAPLPTTLEDLKNVYSTLRASIAGEGATVRGELEYARKDLERTFTTYLERWPDPNLVPIVDAFPEFLAILTELRAKGVYDLHDTWVRSISKWAATDLVPLHAAFTQSVELIETRLQPINAILSGLPFGAEADRLRIAMRHRNPDSVTRFRRKLKELAGLASRDLTELGEADMKATFEAIATFVAQFRDRRDDRAAKDARRDELLDVRRHIQITAERYDPETGAEKSTYDALGGKSGGESQELVAFIVGAALRYQLGDELRDRPRFAPVLLDEGFVKSDGEFTGRSMAAWRTLGFQLVVAAPLDKATSLEAHCDGFLQVVKVGDGYSRALPIPAGASRLTSLASALMEEEARR